MSWFHWFLVIFLGSIFVVSSIYYLYYLQQLSDARKYLDDLAKQLGLSFDPGQHFLQPSLDGELHGIPVAVYGETRTSGKTLEAYTVYKVSLDPDYIPQNLHIVRKGLRAKIGALFSGAGIKLNDQILDKTFIVRATKPDEVHTFFAQPDIKNCLLELSQHCDAFRLEDNALYFDFYRRVIDERLAIRAQLERLVRCAQAINGSDFLANTSQAALPQTATSTAHNVPTIPADSENSW